MGSLFFLSVKKKKFSITSLLISIWYIAVLYSSVTNFTKLSMPIIIQFRSCLHSLNMSSFADAALVSQDLKSQELSLSHWCDGHQYCW